MLTFLTGPETHFLLVRLVRTTSRMFDNKLGGRPGLPASRSRLIEPNETLGAMRA